MDKNTARKLVEDTFNKKFDEEQFTLFIKNFLNDIEPRDNTYSGQYIWDDYKDHIKTYKRIGKYIDPEGEALDVLIIEVKSVAKLERARTALRNFVIKHLSKFDKDFALAAFYSKEDNGEDWRFSFVKLEHQSYLDEEKGKVKTRKEFTPAKRYSFLVGEHEDAYTAKNQLLPLLQNVSSNPTIKDIENAFSIEKVTDEFFLQYKDLYVKLFEHFTNDAKIQQELSHSDIDTVRFTKKLLGQIVFLYFLQKKGWLGVPKDQKWGTGNKRFIQKLFDIAQQENKNFYKEYLQYLFYEALAKERDKENSYYERFDCRIPFLNGGLFEAEYNWQEANITIPEHLFRNEEKNKSGDIGTGVLDVFDRYNFTIKEDEPLDKEVAVDPEMLGKVFENMLDVTERKSKGAYYTPREIVHYMCQESLIHYLDNALNDYNETYQEIGNNQTNLFGNKGKKGQQSLQTAHQKITVPRKDIEQFIKEGHFALENDQRVASKGKETKKYKYVLPEYIRSNADLIDKKLTEIKICDPAIGSGAFPVGLLHELVTAHLVIRAHLSKKYLTDKLNSMGFNPEQKEINESRYIYRLKRHIIQESIYGVDIDASAIDIARLRLWLSLIVDEDDLEPIETLPNLDYKIVCGNSLIGLPGMGASKYPKLCDELEELKDKFYDETNESIKNDLRNKINNKIHEVLKTAEDFEGYKIDFDFQLFFSEVWHEKGGFDVVIGNPPYLRIQGIRKANPAFADLLVKLYHSATGSFDLYVCFTEKGLSLTHPNGLLNFIMPVKWTNSAFGKGLRKIIKQQRAAKKIISFSAHQVFNASTYTGIQFFRKNSLELLYTELDKDLPNKSDLETYISDLNPTDFNEYSISELNEDVWTLTDKKVGKILTKLNKQPNTVESVFSKIFQGIATSKDSVYFIMDAKEDNNYVIGYSKELDQKVKIEKGLVKPLLKGEQVHRYERLKTSNFVIVPYLLKEGKAELMTEKYIQSEYPKGHEYLKLNESILRNRENGRLKNDDFWFRYIYPKNLNLFPKEKLIAPEISHGSNYTYDKSGKFYHNTQVYSYLKREKIKTPYEIWNILLNSGILWYFLMNTGNVLRGGYFRFKTNYLNPFPLPEPPVEITQNLTILHDYLINSKGKNEFQYKFFNSLADAITFELYFPEEFKSANKQILPHLGNLQPISDNMPDEQKLSIIQSEYERLSHLEHPVRKNMDTLDEVEEVKIIKEALK